ncbi:MAG: hypothetical protein EXQ56_14035 [Acidobacteria bacterium]|nr:hypothetical protein [Acidobacteriota bacterium]
MIISDSWNWQREIRKVRKRFAAQVAQAFLPAGFAVLSIRQAGIPALAKAAGKNACATHMPASLLQLKDDFGGRGGGHKLPSRQFFNHFANGKWGARVDEARLTNREFCQIGKFGFFGICGQSGQVGRFGSFDARDGCGVAGKLI